MFVKHLDFLFHIAKEKTTSDSEVIKVNEEKQQMIEIYSTGYCLLRKIIQYYILYVTLQDSGVFYEVTDRKR